MLCEIEPEPIGDTNGGDTSDDSFHTARSHFSMRGPELASWATRRRKESHTTEEATLTVQFIPSTGGWSPVRPLGYIAGESVYINGVLRYTLEKAPRYLHRWSLKDRNGHTVAVFRAGKLGSWLEIQINGRNEIVPRRFSIGNATLEWGERYSLLSSDVSSVRWRRDDHSMVMINDRVLRLPPVASLAEGRNHKSSGGKLETTENRQNSWPSVLRFARSYNAGFTVHWRSLDQGDVILERIVVCTAMIAHWKWSRKLDLINRASNVLQDPLIGWLERNLERGPRMVPLARLITRHPALKRLEEQSVNKAI